MQRSLSFVLFLIWSVSAQAQQSPDGNWPSFRGPYAAGVADEQNLPDAWSGETGHNIKWKIRIPGLAHSSPIIWGDKLIVTTAISGRGEADFKAGLYGEGTASDDHSVHRWDVICLNKKSGKILWQTTVTQGAPIDKRHIKATYANSTPATDGKHIVAMFGSQGLFGLDTDGKVLWQKDLGKLDLGAYDAPSYEWGFASSPIIYENTAIVQCDTQGESFIIACDVTTGETIWKSPRDEQPSWGTPTIYPGTQRVELITNASKFIRGYDPASGEQLWQLGGSSNITAPTPIFKGGLIVVASGRGPERPIFVLRPGASGDITFPDGQTSSEFVQWSKRGRGPYMPTPLIYGDYLYVLANQGILDCYELQTGAEIYRQRIRHSGSGFSASPVAADGKLYLSGEDGDIFVVKADPEYEEISMNKMGELLMASPAISEGMLYVRAKSHLFAIGK